METKKRKIQIGPLGAIISGIATALGLLFTIYVYSESKEDKDIVELQIRIVDKDNKPLEVSRVELKNDYDKFAEGNKTGKLKIPKVRIPSIDDEVQLRVQLLDSSIHEISVAYDRDEIKKIVSLDLVKILDGQKLESLEIPAEPLLAVNTSLAEVITYSDPLTVRDDPSLQGTKIGSIPRNAKVTILQYVGKPSYVGNKYGRWCQIEYYGTVGYVFGGYLKEVSAS